MTGGGFSIMNKNAISPRRHTKPHEEQKTTAKAIDIPHFCAK